VLRIAIYSRISFCITWSDIIFLIFSMFVLYMTRWRYWAYNMRATYSFLNVQQLNFRRCPDSSGVASRRLWAAFSRTGFKTRLDKFWSNQDVLYNFEAPFLGTGSTYLLTWYVMKSGFVDECLSIAPLVASIHPVLKHINGCGINNFDVTTHWLKNADQATVLLLCTAILYSWPLKLYVLLLLSKNSCLSIFTARSSYASAVLGVVILSVRPSHVCFVTNPKNLPAIFFISYERSILLVFCHPTVVGGRCPFPPKMGDGSDPPPFENRSRRHISMNSLDGATVHLSDGIIIILVICYGADHYFLFV